MNPKTYLGPTMAAALAKVKKDLGRDAVILRTRTVQRGGVMGVGARTWIEITAAREADVDPPRRRRPAATRPAVAAPPAAAKLNDTLAHAAVSAATATLEPQVPTPNAAHLLQDKPPLQPAPAANPPSAPPAELQRELQDIKAMVQSMLSCGGGMRSDDLPAELRRAYIQLVQNQVQENLAAQLVRRIESSRAEGRELDDSFVKRQLLRYVSGILKKGAPIQIESGTRKPVIALIGPTGVGKTTTVAKLAAHFRLRENRRVGLVTVDTYRIAAVEQLKTYARIIDVPLEVALQPSEIQDALGRLDDCDMVFVDTAGRSQFDSARLDELKQFLQAIHPTETHLVLPASGSHAVLMKAVDHFGALGVDKVIFTKVDEAVGVGTMLGVMQRVDARLSYVTAGQEVPNDIQAGDNRALARLIVNGA